MAAPNRAEPLARRHRHAWLLATLTELIGDCARAAGEVYRPVAETPPTRLDVAVDLGPLVGLCRSAGTRVEAARARDAVRCASTEKEAVSVRTDVGADFLADLVESPAQAVRGAQELASTSEYTVNQILDEAADSAVLSGLLALHEVQRQSSPGAAAAKCLAATGHFVLAVSVISLDVPAAVPEASDCYAA
ncbi:hypothetical protein OG824_27420 [Streptomyces prunicolor]|uniref:hypothetical protein n=1 Tax=Streptomyces prunicolor TaxID=67348 RepID=UPI00224D3027|nr:hypothetical protein [Streptomyces prunicolor]MCX5238938.1 hypothetical protein [Streptomyces prunicolor]